MKNTKKKKIEIKPEFVVVYPQTVGRVTRDYTMLITRKELDNQIANRGTDWIQKLYKLGNEVKFLDPKYVED